MNEQALWLDGNALAGLLQELFATELTDAPRSCGSCGAIRAVGAHRLYRGAGAGAPLPGLFCHRAGGYDGSRPAHRPSRWHMANGDLPRRMSSPRAARRLIGPPYRAVGQSCCGGPAQAASSGP